MRYTTSSLSGAFILAVVVLSGLAACAPAPTPTPIPTVTPMPDAQATATAQAQTSATSQSATVQAVYAQFTVAAQTRAPESTATAQARAAQATATTQAILDVVNPLMSSANKAYGPAEGALRGEQTRFGFIKYFDSGLFLRNFAMETQFFNPADGKVNPWDYGFNFRDTGPNRNYRLNVNSDATWRLSYPRLNPDGTFSSSPITDQTGSLRNFDASSTGSNHLRIIINDTSGYFFVNGEFIATLNVSDKNEPGRLSLATVQGGSAHEFPGLAVRYKNFVISSLP